MAEALTCQAARALVSAYMNRELDEEQVRAVEAHIRGCVTCPTLYAGLVAIQHRLRTTPRPSLAPEDLTRMMQRFSERLHAESERE
jgi:predicted anti-sigma-YlaC factor YlaD